MPELNTSLVIVVFVVIVVCAVWDFVEFFLSVLYITAREGFPRQ